MNKSMSSLVLSCALVSCLPHLRAAGLDYLVSEADVIVVGTIRSRIEGPTRVTFRLSVARVLHGNVSGPTVEVVHDWAGLLRGQDRVINQAQTGMWFLKKREGDTWDVIPSRPSMYRSILGLFLPASETPPVRSAGDREVTGRLIEEIASMFRPGSAEDPEVLVGALDGVKAPVITAALPTLFATADAGVQAVALAAMLETQTPDAMSQFVRLWPTIRNIPSKRFVLSALRDSWRDPNPDAVKSLAALAAKDPEVGSVAAATLAAIHSREALPFLANLLLDSDPQVQFHGLYGISAFANGCPIKTKESVVTMQYLDCRQPSAYKTAASVDHFVFRPGPPDRQLERLSFWRDWWRVAPELH